jgi:hypothetical protein
LGKNIEVISGNDTGNQVLTNKNGPIVLTTENEGQQVMGLTISQNGSWYVSPQILSQVASQDVSQEVSQDVSKDVSQNVSQDVSGIISQDVSRIVKETKDYSQDGLQRYDICSVNFSENDTYVTAALKKHVKTTHQIKKGQPEYR